MEITEIKKLIPFYVAGTLEVEERMLVEKALQDSMELQTEVKFWQQAQSAVERYSQFYQEGHLSPEQIVIAAGGHLSFEKKEHSEIERHLKECEMCRHEVEIIKSTYSYKEVESIKVPSEEKISKWLERDKQIGYLGSFKLADVFAVAAVILIIVIVFYTSINKRGMPLIPQENYVDLIIPFSQSTRGNAFDEIPNLKFDSNTTRVNVTVYVPHSEIDSLRYSASISLPSGADTMISNTLLPLRFDSTLDTIRFDVGREFFKTVSAKYRLALSEMLPLSKSYLTPESYIYTFYVR